MNPLAEFRMLNDKIDELEAELSLAEKIIKIQGEALDLISATDTADKAPDLFWLSSWRNNTKERARKALKEVEEIRNESKIINAELG